MSTTLTTEEVKISSAALNTVLSRYTDETTLLVKEAGSKFAEAVGGAKDKESAAMAFYAAGALMSEVALMLDKGPVSSVMAAYGMALSYAANVLIN